MLHCTPFTDKNVTEGVTQVPFAEVGGHEPGSEITPTSWYLSQMRWKVSVGKENWFLSPNFYLIENCP